MTATVHPLFPIAPPKSALAGAPTHPLVEELQRNALGALEELLARMFDHADDLLFEMGEKSGGDAERRRYFDTMRVLRWDRGKISEAFSDSLKRGFAPEPERPRAAQEFDLESLSIQPTEELEEKIAVTNMAAKAEGLFKNLIWELERRLENAARQHGVPVSPRALSPTRICEAFGQGAAALETDFQIKLVVYKLFERVVIRELGPVYAAALELLDRHGIRLAHQAPQEKTKAASPDGTAVQSHAQLQELLQRYGIEPSALARASQPAAAELAAVLQSLLAQPSGLAALQASSQRLALASRLFDEVLAEPLLPQPLRPALETLRYPIYQSALTDTSFFTNPTHPLRKLLADVVELAVSAPNADVVQAQLRQALSATGMAAGTAALAGGAPLPEGEVENFLQQMHEQTRARREALLMRVRRQVAQELEVQTLGRNVPAPVMTLLRGGVGPLMAARLLKYGRGSAQYREAQDLLERTLRSLEFIPPPSLDELKSREALMSAIVTALADVGMAEDKIESLLNGLQEVYAILDSAETKAKMPEGAVGGERLSAREERLLMSEFHPANPPAAAGEERPEASREAESSRARSDWLELLGRILAPEGWFRVYDAERDQTRWLKLNSYYPQKDAITFTGFDESHKLNLRARRFAEDLALGHSEPVNPDARAREALDELRRAKAEGRF